MKGQTMGSISFNKRRNKFIAKYYHTLKNEVIYIGSFESEEMAKEQLRIALFEFYSSNSFLLPKNINIHRKSNSYIFAIPIKKVKTHLFFSKELQEVIDYRIDFIKNLL